MGAIKQAIIGVVGASEYESLVNLRNLDQTLGTMFEEVRRAAEYVRSAQKDVNYKLDRCREDWQNINNVFYGESLVADVAKYERKLAEYRIRESSFVDYWHELSLPSEIVLDLLDQARNGAR